MGKQWKQWLTSFLSGSKITADDDCRHEIKRCLLLGRKGMTNLDSILHRNYFAKKGPSSQSYSFSSSHIRMWELDYKKSWAQNNWCFWTVVLEKTFESPLTCKEIKPVNPKGNQSWVFIGRMNAEAETPVLWPPDVKNWLGKTLMLGKIESRGWRGQQRMDGWMASPTQWTWVWAVSRSCWWTGKPVMIQSMESQSRIRLSDWTSLNRCCIYNS